MDILVIDDEIEVATMLVDLIDYSTSNFSWPKCKAFYSAKDASEYLAKNQIDLVITDIDMRNSSDIGGGERILSEMSTRRSTVWVYTGGNEDKLTELLNLGADKVFFKPHIEDLMTALDELIFEEIVLSKYALYK